MSQATALQKRMATVRRVTSKETAAGQPEPHVAGYLASLRVAANLPAPYSSLLFVSLACWLRIHEVLDPRSATTGQTLVLAQRTIRLPRSAQLVLHGRTGSLADAIGLGSVSGPAALIELRAAVQRDRTAQPRSLEQLWCQGVAAVMSNWSDGQNEVLLYAGINKVEQPPCTDGATFKTPDCLENRVADRLDELVRAAGFGV